MSPVLKLQLLLLLVAGLYAFVPARYLYRYFSHSPARRDIVPPVEDLDWRNPKYLAQNAAFLAALVAFSIFIFTPPAAYIAKQPTFVPIMFTLFGAWCLYSVTQGLATGSIRPFVRGVDGYFDRETKPKRFWLSAGWNATLGGMMLFIGIKNIEDAPLQALAAQCNNFKNRNLSESMSACNELLRRSDSNENSKWYASRGNIKHKMRDFSGAVEDYSLALRDEPRNYTILYNRGLSLEKLDKVESAIADYTSALKAWPESTLALHQRGLLYLDTARYDQAIADFTRQHALDPKDAYPLANRGISYAWMGDRSRAESDFAKAKALDPTNVVVLRGQVVLNREAGDANTTLALLDAVLDKHPQDPWALYFRAKGYRVVGDTERARADEAALQRIESAGR